MLPDHAPSCDRCADRAGAGFDTPFTMAFQPIFDVQTRAIFAYEALVRPIGDGSAYDVLSKVTPDNRYSFDQLCRKRAIRLAAQLGMTTNLSINFMPNAVYNPDHCIRATLWAAEKYGFPIERIIFEFTESESIDDIAHLRRIVGSYKSRGFRTAIDDLGSGYTGLGLLADSQSEIIKLDMSLVRGIDADKRRQAIVGNLLNMCRDMGMLCVLEGVETPQELRCVLSMGARYIQGYVLARPTYEALESSDVLAERLDAALGGGAMPLAATAKATAALGVTRSL